MKNPQVITVNAVQSASGNFWVLDHVLVFPFLIADCSFDKMRESIEKDFADNPALSHKSSSIKHPITVELKRKATT